MWHKCVYVYNLVDDIRIKILHRLSKISVGVSGIKEVL